MLSSISLNNFRTHTKSEFSITSPLCFILGQNAVGKTNLLEAIYVTLLTKSFRSTHTELITQDEDFYKITSVINTPKDKTLETRFFKTPKGYTREYFVDQVKTPAKNIIGLYPVVLFEPNDLNIILAGPQIRRTFLDILLSQADPKYLQQLSIYKRLLRQRNKLIWSINKGNVKIDELFVYNLQIVDPAHYVTQARQDFIEGITLSLTKAYQSISGSSERVLLGFQPSLPTQKEYVLKELEKSQQKDLIVGHTTRGPHRDNLTIELHDNIATTSLSRGEIRSLTLALKIVELQYLHTQTKIKPLLLLDDVFSELDTSRQQHLWNTTKDYQTIITTTHLEKKMQLPDHQIIELKV